MVVRSEFTHPADAGVVRAVDAVETVGVIAALLTGVVATHLAGATAVGASAAFTATATRTGAIRVTLAFHVLQAALHWVAGVSGLALARWVEAAAFDARIDRAGHAVAALIRRAARAAAGPISGRAALLTIPTAWSEAAHARRAHTDG